MSLLARILDDAGTECGQMVSGQKYGLWSVRWLMVEAMVEGR